MSASGVAAPNGRAAQAAAGLLSEGGNALDAAIASTLVACVNEPGICSLGGGAYVTLLPTRGPALTIDGYVEMPGRGVDPEAFGGGFFEIMTDYGGGVAMSIGHGSIATPGTLAALGRAHDEHGRAPWAEVVAPAAEVARDGFPMGRASTYYLEYVHLDIFGWHPTSHAAIHDRDGVLIPTGELVRMPELADALDHIGHDGWRTGYVGDLAQVIADHVQGNGGLLTRTDLAAYDAVLRPSLTGRFGEWELATNPLPAIGGVSLLTMLRLMDGWTNLDDVGLRRLVAVQDAVLGFRVQRVDGAIDPSHQLGILLELAEEDLEALAAATRTGGQTSPSTVHTSVVDGAGIACSITASSGYGSGVMVPGTGIWMNNSLGEHELNVRGVHALDVGTRLPSNMAPTVGRDEHGRILAIGSPGADRITTATLQTLTALAGGLDLESAIRHPRLHVRHLEDGPLVSYEEDLDLPDLDLRTRPEHTLAMFFGGVGAVLRQPNGGVQVGADPRRTGETAMVR